MAGLGHGSWPWSAMVMVMGHGLHDDDVSMMMMFDVVADKMNLASIQQHGDHHRSLSHPTPHPSAGMHIHPC